MLLLALWVCPFAQAADDSKSRLEISGVPSELAEQLVKYAGEPASDSPSGLRHWQRKVEQRLPQSLAALGYNSPAIDSTLKDGYLTVQLSLGPATTYSAVDVHIVGEGQSEELFNQFIKKLAPKPGQQLVHADYESFKANLLAVALTLGYFDAQYSTHRLAVSRRQHSAQLDLELDSGQRYRYGPVNFSNSELSPEFLQQWVGFKEGEFYKSSDVDTFARDLRDSGYFNGVRVRPEIDRAVDGVVPINVESKLREPHSATIGIGYGTDSGPRLRGSITRHYVNKHGHSAGVDTELSAESQELSTFYRLPHHPDPANHYLQLDAGVANTIIDDASSLRYTIGANHHRINSNKWLESYSLKFQHETSEIDGEKSRIKLLIPGASWSREKTRTIADWGTLKYSVDFQINTAREALLSDIDFDRFYLKLGSGHAFSSKHLLHARMELGWIESNDFQQVPLSLRFYAGGDDSIRGFARREVSPQDADGNAIGGRYLTTLSTEYEYRLRDSLGLAFFVDMGRAGYNEFDPIAYGGGLGLRWYSPVGPIKVYIGVPLKGDDKSPRFHLSMGS
ncbi:MAG: autotransporter assembly complex protein TamA [Granulosicoccaceae bacterium]